MAKIIILKKDDFLVKKDLENQKFNYRIANSIRGHSNNTKPLLRAAFVFEFI
jgi:hypothetical protein